MSDQTTLSPSRLVVTAAGLKPVGTTRAASPCRCAMCGTEIQAGELLDAFMPGDAFTDTPALAAPTSTVVCGDCKAVWRKEFMQKYSKSVICAEGVFPFAKMENQAYWLLNPPATPYIVIVSDQQQQHLVWRAPVNTSQDLMRIRFGGAVLAIRRQVLRQALEASSRLTERLNAGNKKAGTKTPFERLDWHIEDLRHGRLRLDILALTDEQSRQDINLLRRLTPGEYWALCVLIAGKTPVRPDPVITPATGMPIAEKGND